MSTSFLSLGPDFWGLLNLDWQLCTKGRRQSPVDVVPATLLHDPDLRPLFIDKHSVSGSLENNGHSVVFRVDASNHSHHADSMPPPRDAADSNANKPVTIRGGPLSYTYTFDT